MTTRYAHLANAVIRSDDGNTWTTLAVIYAADDANLDANIALVVTALNEHQAMLDLRALPEVAEGSV